MFKIIYFIVTTVAVIFIAAYATDKGDPTVFPYSAEQARNILAVARTALPRRDGPGQIEIWSTGYSEKGVALNMQYASWASLLKCEAIITAIAPDKSRVVPDCGRSAKQDLASARMTDEARVPMFEEHIQSIMNKRVFDRTNADRKTASVVIKNIGGLHAEAMKSADEAAQVQLGLKR